MEVRVGVYSRAGVTYEVAESDGGLQVTVSLTSALMAQPPFTVPLVPHSEDVLLMQIPGLASLVPAVFLDLDGDRYFHVGARTTRRSR